MSAIIIYIDGLNQCLQLTMEFKKLGYKIEYQSFVDYFPIFRGGFQKKLEHASIKSACRGRHDIVMMAFHHSTSDLCMKISTEERIEILKKINGTLQYSCMVGYG